MALNPAEEQRLSTWRATLQQVAGIGAGRSYPLALGPTAGGTGHR